MHALIIYGEMRDVDMAGATLYRELAAGNTPKQTERVNEDEDRSGSGGGQA